jgi:hypothetical protein
MNPVSTQPTRIVDTAQSIPAVETVPVADINVDETVQRGLIPARLKKLAEELDLDALGVVTVSQRDNGEYVVIDGQHRLAALKEHEMGEWDLTCNVYRHLTLAQEAALFRRLNDTRKITSYDDYSKGLVEGDPEIVAINGIVQRHGLKVRNYGHDGTVTCVTKIRQLYQSKDGLPAGQNLDEALEVSLGAWGQKAAAVEKSLLGGIALVLRKHPDIDKRSLTEGLAKFGGGAAGVLGKARLFKEVKAASIEKLCGEVIVENYNKRRRQGKLDSVL